MCVCLFIYSKILIFKLYSQDNIFLVLIQLSIYSINYSRLIPINELQLRKRQHILIWNNIMTHKMRQAHARACLKLRGNELTCFVLLQRNCSLIKFVFNANNNDTRTMSIFCSLPAGIYLFKINNGNTRTICKIC